MNLLPKIVPIADLTCKDRTRMFELMARHYENVSTGTFECDLAEKHWVIQVWHPEDDLLCGFSTQMVMDLQRGQRPVKALFSGDTIIDKQYWGQQALMHGWGQLVVSLLEEQRQHEWYWFLLSQGYKTYRYLPLFFRAFYPCHDCPTPVEAQETLDALARLKYPHRYDSTAGVIRATADQYCLRKGIADVTPERLEDPHVRFFLERNTGHANGDELCCIAPLSLANFTRAGSRFLRGAAAPQ